MNLLLVVKGRVIMMKIERNRAITPPNLLGILRRIAYANKKYHSGWIWGGVIMGFASMKFSGSLRRYGLIRTMDIKGIRRVNTPKMSFHEKKGWNVILSIFIERPIGLEDPVVWRNIKWIIIIKAMINGRIKCREKNRVRVGLSTENPPHIQYVIWDPM